MNSKQKLTKQYAYLPRSEKHCHVVVSQEMHFALQQYATKNGLSITAAVAKLIKQGILFEKGDGKSSESSNRASITREIADLITQQMKEEMK